MNEKEIIDKSVELVQTAMKDVISEFLIKLEDESQHIVYIHSFDIDNNGCIEYDFSTPSTDRKAELIPHIEIIFKTMIEDFGKSKKSKMF